MGVRNFSAGCLSPSSVVALGGDSSWNPLFPCLFATSTLRSLSYFGFGYVEINRYNIPLGPIQLRQARLDSEVGCNIPSLVWVMGRFLWPGREGWHPWAMGLRARSPLRLGLQPRSSPWHNPALDAAAQSQHLPCLNFPPFTSRMSLVRARATQD